MPPAVGAGHSRRGGVAWWLYTKGGVIVMGLLGRLDVELTSGWCMVSQSQQGVPGAEKVLLAKGISRRPQA